MNRFLKRVLLLITILNFSVAAFELPESYGQTFSEAGVFENEHATAVIPNFSEDDQFAVGECDITEGMSEWFQDNRHALSQLVSQADQVVVYGLQDEIDNFERGLGECRSQKIIQLINQWAWSDLFETLKISSQGYHLANDEKTKILEEHQKYLNQRGVAIVAFNDSDFWWPPWLFWLIGGLALLALALSLAAWWGSGDDNRSNRNSNGSSDRSGNRDNRPGGSSKSRSDASKSDSRSEGSESERSPQKGRQSASRSTNSDADNGETDSEAPGPFSHPPESSGKSESDQESSSNNSSPNIMVYVGVRVERPR